jgi:hypothetical protein
MILVVIREAAPGDGNSVIVYECHHLTLTDK